MGKLILRRVLWAVPVLVASVLVTFSLMHLAPGSPWDPGIEDPRQTTQELSPVAVARLDARYGLDQPWWKQVGLYLRNVAQFDFGESYRNEGQSVRGLIGERIGPTLTLAGMALVLAVTVGVSTGVLAALRHNSRLDVLLTGFATLVASVPGFVVGIVLVLVLSVGLSRATGGAFFLPASGFDLGARLLMPVVTLSLLPLAFLARLTRSATLETLGQDHVRTARAKGLPRRVLLCRHVLRNSLAPVVTSAGSLFVFLVSGTIVVERVFQVPGLGSAFLQAIALRDYPVILGATVVYTAVVVVANLAVDIAYGFVDPRVRAT